jgi:N-ethylmaleimide reductase
LNRNTACSAPETQTLLQPLSIAGLTLPNRVVMAPMTRGRTNNIDLAPVDIQATYYAQRASAALLITEGTWVSEDAIGFANVPGIFTHTQVSAWRKVTDAVHAAGGRILVQLGHTGSKSHPDVRGGRLPSGPSAINPEEMVFSPTAGFVQSLTPRAFTTEEIEQTIEDYRTAAINARRAGFDGVEVHAQGPQLVGQFLNPILNQRTDRFGGNATNRARFLLEAVAAIACEWSPSEISVKLSPYWTNGSTFPVSDGLLEDYDQLVAQLGGAGAGILHLMGRIPAPDEEITTAQRFEPFQRYRALFPGVLIANVGFDQDSANALITDGLADAVSFGELYIGNPDLVERFAEHAHLASSDPETYFTGDARGYLDYPAISDALVTPQNDRLRQPGLGIVHGRLVA